jgi:putative exporter of polyketide antibiotics
MNALTVTLVTTLTDTTPQPADVKAGPWWAVILLLLLVAVALLGWSLSRQLKKARRNMEAGILPSAKAERHQREDHAPKA